ncbi:hypothetical protein OF83DRAFT_562895 [Amylostereum chailletii]|nr:hypothetical protein OF83DRAFT_562895 [Amylostereum chailletii]
MPVVPTDQTGRGSLSPHPYRRAASLHHTQRLPQERLASTSSSLPSAASSSSLAVETLAFSIPHPHQYSDELDLSPYDIARARSALDVLNHSQKSLLDPLAEILNSTGEVGKSLTKARNTCCTKEDLDKLSSMRRNRHLFSNQHLLSQPWSTLQHTVIRRCPRCWRVSGLGVAMKKHLATAHDNAELKADILLVRDLEDVQEHGDLERCLIPDGLSRSGSSTRRNRQSQSVSSSGPSRIALDASLVGPLVPVPLPRSQTPLGARLPAINNVPRRHPTSRPHVPSPLHAAHSASNSGVDRTQKISRDHRKAQHPYISTHSKLIAAEDTLKIALFANPFPSRKTETQFVPASTSSYSSLANALGPGTLRPNHTPIRLPHYPSFPPAGAFCMRDMSTKKPIPHTDLERVNPLSRPEGAILLNSCGSLDGALVATQALSQPVLPPSELSPVKAGSPSTNSHGPDSADPLDDDDYLEELFNDYGYNETPSP